MRIPFLYVVFWTEHGIPVTHGPFMNLWIAEGALMGERVSHLLSNRDLIPLPQYFEIAVIQDTKLWKLQDGQEFERVSVKMLWERKPKDARRVIREQLQLLRETSAINPDFTPLTQADIDKAVEEYRAKKAGGDADT